MKLNLTKEATTIIVFFFILHKALDSFISGHKQFTGSPTARFNTSVSRLHFTSFLSPNTYSYWILSLNGPL